MDLKTKSFNKRISKKKFDLHEKRSGHQCSPRQIGLCPKTIAHGLNWITTTKLCSEQLLRRILDYATVSYIKRNMFPSFVCVILSCHTNHLQPNLCNGIRGIWYSTRAVYF